ncbi:hypothetical protein, variant [Cladophialophora immunda]|uniref:DNA-directed RNA polymerase III subunit RPC6 n=1 Tax=Cladophialophora immunda TaxID=569365 RepID=A0A0D2BBJ3_9EURO|nr:uncharacterized protein PV07_01674 [Cladophialophora immunda]XP_016255153.1 hypothetical protein, variant [Cladophialophora immunda]KIW34936.1 hypothetical protein PV07_01674 [Cladophialophora immunda]KIW34937.1 hypothetical protein, variant [Cladophialophora immunda]
MAPPKNTTAPDSGPSTAAPVRDRTAEALHAWCCQNYTFGHVFSQAELLDAGIVPNQDLQILLSSVEYLTKNSLFRVHDRAGGGIGWELVDPEVAKDYANLSRNEKIVLQVIDGAKSSGMWTKQIQSKTALHGNILEKVYRVLEGRGLVKQMKSVSHPSRKMYILAGLTPSEDATGGSWFSEGRLDIGLIDTISTVIEHYVSTQSWQEIKPDDTEESLGQKRKRPSGGFEEHGDDRSKLTKTSEGQNNKVRSSKHQASAQRSYRPFAPGYKSYPTLQDITRHILDIKVTGSVLPQNAIAQLLQVMVYDDRLFKLHRPPHGNELPDDHINNTVTMYRCFKTPQDITEQHQLVKRKVSHHDDVRKAAYRQEELERLGEGGSSEVPCLRCPSFDICGDGGPVNVVTCKYFDEWYERLEEADEWTAEKEKGKEKTKERDKDKGKDKEHVTVNGDRGPRVDIELELEPS